MRFWSKPMALRKSKYKNPGVSLPYSYIFDQNTVSKKHRDIDISAP